MNYLNQNKIYELIKTGEVVSLDSELEIEDCINAISDSDQKIAFLKRLKKDRVETIDAEICRRETNCELIRNIILATLKKNNLKSLDFPGVGRVNIKTTKGKWVVKDEAKLFESLNKLPASEISVSEINDIFQTTPKLVKKELDKWLDSVDKAGKTFPNVVEKETGKTGISLSVYERTNISKDNVTDDTDTADANYDKIEF